MRPEPNIAFDGFTIRRGSPSDANAVASYFRKNREHLARTSPIRPENFYTEDYWRVALTNADAGFEADRLAHFFLFLGARPIGVVNLSNFVRGAFHACHLGFSIDADFEGQGIMSRAVASVVDYAFDVLGMHRVMANYLPDNDRSARLLSKLGFAKEGFAERYLLIGGEWRDHVLTARINHAWRPPRFASPDTHVSLVAPGASTD